jgi:hypothetical protein
MKRITAVVCLIAFMSLFPSTGWCQGGEVLFREDFLDLAQWKPLFFPKIQQHSVYTVVTEGDSSFLRAESNASASGIIFSREFDVFAYPKVRWRWKIANIYRKGNAEEKSGDDYPIRIYIIFKYDPETAPFGQRLKYGIAKTIYGEYPPHSTLNYVWASRKYPQRIITNPYAAEAKMILLEAGTEKVGHWVDEEVDIIRDYRNAFGIMPPGTASIAIMNDSDNTGERSVSYVDYIEVYK